MMSNRLKRTIKPQVIQYLSVKAHKSALTTDLAAVCNVDAEWLASANGVEPGTETKAYQVRSEPRHLQPPPVTIEDKLRSLIDAKAIGKKDLELLLQMAERMAKHATTGA